MAQKRMFSKQITDSDAFIEMPLSTQCLYFHLGMQADDDGFINAPKRIQRVIGASDDDLKLLIAKKFIIPFESGVVVQKHWHINNNIRSDRYKETVYLEEKSLLESKPNGAYALVGLSDGIPTVSVDKNRLGEIRLDKDREERGRFTPPTLSEVQSYIEEKGYHIDAEAFINFYESKGWMIGKNKMKSWKGAIGTWESRWKSEHPNGIAPKETESRSELFARLYEEHRDDI